MFPIPGRQVLMFLETPDLLEIGHKTFYILTTFTILLLTRKTGIPVCLCLLDISQYVYLNYFISDGLVTEEIV